MKQQRIIVLFYIVLTLFTTFVFLYEFVIPHGGVIIEDPVITTTTTQGSTDGTATTDESGTSTTTDSLVLSYSEEIPSVLEDAEVLGSYESENVLITIYQIRMYSSDIYVADVVVSDASVILTALAYNTFGGTNVVQTVSDMAEDHNAIFAINADYASHYDTGIVIRNGSILRTSISSRDAVALWSDGTISTFAESSTTAQELLEEGAWQVWSFGPVLVEDGVAVSDVNDGLDRDKVDNPRTAFGMVSANHFMFITVDGRTTASQGVDIEELADIMLTLGCTEAYNFDGGGSSTMYFDGEVINVPSQGSERKVGDCVYIIG